MAVTLEILDVHKAEELLKLPPLETITMCQLVNVVFFLYVNLELYMDVIPGRSFRERRFVDPVNKNTHEYQLGHIPTEWEATVLYHLSIRVRNGAQPTITLKKENLSIPEVRSCSRSIPFPNRYKSYKSKLCKTVLHKEAQEKTTRKTWIRGKRKNPPTIEWVVLWKAELGLPETNTSQWNMEILQNEKSREEIKTKAEEALERDTLNLAAGHRDGLVAQPGKTQIKGHASATLFGKQVPSEEPSSTANTFQPGSWAAPAAADQKK
ncbi:hypothetical protein XELAEV_18008249mg [Xenopus laevis]|uniref:Uncharacterized protein n=1 Tax=Xenopus laevis TaxID=8355 RepID=A0A974I5F4_XENLA|nr:hypothetical protein XELAEV_18008249mg [Xenopus laevis]